MRSQEIDSVSDSMSRKSHSQDGDRIVVWAFTVGCRTAGSVN